MIIVDDGSTDTTNKLAKSFKNSRIKYLTIDNGGPSKARNCGVQRAEGKWIMYLDSDDELLPKCIEVMMEWANKIPAAVFAIPRSTRTLELYENGELTQSVDDSGDTPPEFSIQDIFDRTAGFSPNGFMHLRNLANEGLVWDEM